MRDRKYIIVVTILLSLLIRMVKKMETEQGYGLGIGGCKRLCPAANETWLGYTIFSVCVG